MIQISNSIEIQRPVLQVFEFVADFENNPRWMPVESVRRISPGDVGKGTRFKQQFTLMGANYQVDCLITRFEPHKKISFEYVSPIFNWHGDYMFEAKDGATRMSAKGQIALGGPYRMAETMFAPKIQRLFNDTAPRLKKILES